MTEGFSRRFLTAALCVLTALNGLSAPAAAEEAALPSCAHEHTVTREEPGTQPTCTKPGGHTMVTVCADCGEEMSRRSVEDTALGHDYKKSVIPPTCTEDGRVTWTCVRCGDSYTEKGEAALGHDYAKTATPPSCTEAGKTVWVCPHCGDTYSEEDGAALGHDYAETARTDASPDAEGSITYTCSRCGDVRVEILPRLKPEEERETPEQQTGEEPEDASAGEEAEEASGGEKTEEAGETESGETYTGGNAEEQEEPGEEPDREPGEETEEKPEGNPDGETGGETERGSSEASCPNEKDGEPAAPAEHREIATWADLQAALSEGGTVVLTRNITAEAEDGALTVPAGREVVLDLAGYTVDRGLNAPAADGYVIQVFGSLTVAGDGGITGGKNTGSGGGVYVGGGSLTVLGGRITGCSARYGGGVFVAAGSFTFSGGSVSGNSAEYGGGVCTDAGDVAVCGGEIAGNTAAAGGSEVFVNSGRFIMESGSVK